MTHSRTAFKGWPLTVLIISILTLYFARVVLIPLALALTLTFILSPAVVFLEKLRLGRTLSVLVLICAAIGAGGFTGSIVVNQLLAVIEELPQYRDNIQTKMAALRSPVGGSLGRALNSLKELRQDVANQPSPTERATSRVRHPVGPAAPQQVQIVEPPNDGLGNIRDILVPVVAPIEMAFIVLIFTVFMLLKREDLRNRLFRLVGVGQLGMMTTALDDAAQRISKYLLMQMAVNGLFGILFGAGLYFIGVPAATLWGVLAALARFVPYVGTAAAAILPFMLSVAVTSGWHAPLLVFVLFTALELSIGNFVEPMLYGQHIGISPLALLVTTTFWTMLWGWAGLILSTPLTVLLSVLGRYVPQLSFLHVMLGDEDALGPEAQFYQRLLAMDQEEARSIAEKYLADQPLVKMYDSVMIPALSMAEQDRHKGGLDQSRESFILLSTKELIAELAEFKLEERTDAPPMPGRIICIPASDQADEVTASILGQVLEREGMIAISLPLSPTPEKLLSRLAPGPEDIIFICALPPFAFARARTLFLTLRNRLKECKIVIGLWGYAGDSDRAMEKFTRLRPDAILTTLESAVLQVAEWHGQVEPAPAESTAPTLP